METVINLPKIHSYVFVMKAKDPELLLYGSRAFQKSQDEVKRGINIFSDLSITIMQENKGGLLK